MSRRVRRMAAGVAISALTMLVALPTAGQGQETFADRIARLSEPPGYFDTDNLITNERSYLEVAPALESAALAGGVYVGVGPDQNFSYIARIEPALAFILDVRRDNLLLHLLFKALFSIADTRAEYLSLLFGCDPPAASTASPVAAIEALVAHIDACAPEEARALDVRVRAAVMATGVDLSGEDFATIRRFHRTFIVEGLALQFESHGRAPRPGYPSYRELLLERDASGRLRHFLTADEDYLVVRTLQRRDRIVPLVGDLSGPKTLAGIGALLDERGQRLSAIYVSNVESYLQGGRFGTFLANLARLPRTPGALVVRAVFASHTRALRPGYGSTSRAQVLDDLLNGHANGSIRSYWDVISGLQ